MCKGRSSFLRFSIGPDALLCQPLNYLFFLTIVIRFQHAERVSRLFPARSTAASRQNSDDPLNKLTFRWRRILA
jgi:hypothetical protein